MRDRRMNVSRNAKIFDLILRIAGRPILKTALLKLAYMVDLHAWRVLGAPLTDLQYVRYKQGPFDTDFYAAIAELDLTSSRCREDFVANHSFH
jgi:hypothetical protein